MALTPYCTNDEVRAALGVTISEIKDEVLDLPIYAMGLRRELNRISTSLPAAFSSVNAKASPTELQRTLLDSVKLFAIYSVAKQAGAALAMAAPKSLNDDKSGFSRDSNSPYKDVLDRVEILFQQARQDLISAFSAFSGAASAVLALPPGLAVSTRGYDPVTGA